MTHFRLPSFFTSWLENMFSDFSARQIMRERNFKRRETAQSLHTQTFTREKQTEQKDIMRSIRRIRTVSVN